MVQSIIIGVVLAVFAAVIGFLFWKIESKIDKIERNNEASEKEQLKIRIAERELLIAEAEISAVMARSLRGEYVNGDLETAEKTLVEKKKAIENLMLKTAIIHEERG